MESRKFPQAGGVAQAVSTCLVKVKANFKLSTTKTGKRKFPLHVMIKID
jgi:hypothetical protein